MQPITCRGAIDTTSVTGIARRPGRQEEEQEERDEREGNHTIPATNGAARRVLPARLQPARTISATVYEIGDEGPLVTANLSQGEATLGTIAAAFPVPLCAQKAAPLPFACWSRNQGGWPELVAYSTNTALAVPCDAQAIVNARSARAKVKALLVSAPESMSTEIAMATPRRRAPPARR
jgi:hypothetical protein